MTTIVDDLLRAVRECAARPEASLDTWPRPYRPHPGDIPDDQYLVMLKPELTASLRAPDGPDLLAWVLDTLAAGGLRPHAVRVLSGTYLAEHRVVQATYPMLNAISTAGLARVSEAATARLRRRFPAYADHPERVLGGHQFLDRFAGFSPRSLDVLTQNLPGTKLGAGTYAVEARVDDERYLLLNAFHPFQLAHFTTAGAAIVLLECLSTRPLSDIRARTIGVIDPRAAHPGSVRHGLADPDSPWSGRWSVCTSLNAVHVSPSAVEAMFAVQRYFDTGDLARTVLGGRLRAAGADLAEVRALAGDPQVSVAGLSGPLFEITEDMPAGAAAALVLRLLTGHGGHG